LTSEAAEQPNLRFNGALVADVNGDGRVSLFDVLLVVNVLRQHGATELSQLPVEEYETWLRMDVDQDNRVTIHDVLMMIVALREQGLGETSGEGEAPSDGLVPTYSGFAPLDPEAWDGAVSAIAVDLSSKRR
jgi:hypothetical protein